MRLCFLCRPRSAAVEQRGYATCCKQWLGKHTYVYVVTSSIETVFSVGTVQNAYKRNECSASADLGRNGRICKCFLFQNILQKFCDVFSMSECIKCRMIGWPINDELGRKRMSTDRATVLTCSWRNRGIRKTSVRNGCPLRCRQLPITSLELYQYTHFLEDFTGQINHTEYLLIYKMV
jgi:hypothetical protein